MSTKSSPLIIRHAVISLEDAAVVQVSALIWKRELAKILSSGSCKRPLKGPLPTVKSFAKVPSAIENLINKYIVWMKQALIEWIRYHHRRIFFSYAGQFTILKYFDQFSWRSNGGTIDFYLTAKNLIANTDLSNILKHRLACHFCLEDDVRRLWPLVQIKGSTECDRNYSYVVFYWDMYMKNEFIDPALFQWIQHTVDNYPMVLYFWNTLKPKDKAQGAANIITRHKYAAYSKRLLPLMTETQVNEFIKISDYEIICDLAFAPENSEYALQLWNHMKEIISDQNFVDMVKDILDFPIRDHEHVLTLIYDIWQDTPQRLKNLILKDHAILDTMLKMWLRVRFPVMNLSRDVRWLLELLRCTNQSARCVFWSQNWNTLIVGVKSNRLNELIKLCLEDDQKVADFKKENLVVYEKIEIYCNLLSNHGYLNELEEFLNFCSNDRNVVKDLKRKIAWSKGLLIYCLRYYDDVEKMHFFEAFIREVYPDPDYRKSFKSQMVVSSKMLAYLREAINFGVLRPVKHLAQLFLSREEDIILAKNCLRQHCHLNLANAKFNKFDIDEWNEFLMWTMNDDKDQFDEFKKSISMEDVYNGMFNKCVCDIEKRLTSDYPMFFEPVKNQDNDSSADWVIFKDCFADARYVDLFDKLDNFLTWYLVSKSKTDEFKMQKMNAWNVPPLSEFFRTTPDNISIEVVKWLCNEDKKKVKKFMSVLGMED